MLRRLNFEAPIQSELTFAATLKNNSVHPAHPVHPVRMKNLLRSAVEHSVHPEMFRVFRVVRGSQSASFWLRPQRAVLSAAKRSVHPNHYVSCFSGI
jgi:hypothetical protein